MARFPYHEKNVKELGKLIAKAAIDADFRNALQANPKIQLTGIGLPDQTTQLIDFKVVSAKEHPNAVALPFRLNEKKLSSSNEAYLDGISKMFDLN